MSDFSCGRFIMDLGQSRWSDRTADLSALLQDLKPIPRLFTCPWEPDMFVLTIGFRRKNLSDFRLLETRDLIATIVNADNMRVDVHFSSPEQLRRYIQPTLRVHIYELAGENTSAIRFRVGVRPPCYCRFAKTFFATECPIYQREVHITLEELLAMRGESTAIYLPDQQLLFRNGRFMTTTSLAHSVTELLCGLGSFTYVVPEDQAELQSFIAATVAGCRGNGCQRCLMRLMGLNYAFCGYSYLIYDDAQSSRKCVKSAQHMDSIQISTRS